MERITNRLSSIGQAGHYDVRRTSENMVLDPGDVVMEDRLQRTFSNMTYVREVISLTFWRATLPRPRSSIALSYPSANWF